MTDKGQDIIARALKAENLPSLSPIAVGLLNMASDEDASVKDLAGLIQQEPGLTTRLLRLANSTAYKRSADDITSVDRAVVMLGLAEVRVLALSMSIKDSLPLDCPGIDYPLFWRTSMHRAILARLGAVKLGLANPEEAFVAGLIMEMGLPLMMRVLVPNEAKGYPGVDKSLKEQIVWQQVNLGTDHRQLGRAVFEAWALPKPLVDCQRIIPSFSESPTPDIIKLCDFARRAAESFFAPGVESQEVYEVAELRFGWSEEELNQLLLESLTVVGEAAEAMEVDLNTQAEMLAALEKARQAVIKLRADLAQELRADGDAASRRRVFGAKHGRLKGLGGFMRKLASAITGDDSAQREQEIREEVDRLNKALIQIEAALDEGTA